MILSRSRCRQAGLTNRKDLESLFSYFLTPKFLVAYTVGMSGMNFMSADRKAVRRQVSLPCQAVGMSDFSLLGDRILDLSPYGMMLACDRWTAPGEEVVVSFQTPFAGHWIDVEGRVARTIHGGRQGDPGYCAGIEFDELDERSERLLRWSLHGIPPAVPKRALKTARGRRILELVMQSWFE